MHICAIGFLELKPGDIIFSRLKTYPVNGAEDVPVLWVTGRWEAYRVSYPDVSSNTPSVGEYLARTCRIGLYEQEIVLSAIVNSALEAIQMLTLIPALRLVGLPGSELSKESSTPNAVAAILSGAVFKNNARSIRHVQMGS